MKLTKFPQSSVTMRKTRENSSDAQQVVVELHKSGNGYKKIAKQLKCLFLLSIIKKFKTSKDVKNLQGK